MRQLLMVLLITAIACDEISDLDEKSNNLLDLMGVEIDTVELNSFLKDIYNKVSAKFKKIQNEIKDDIQFLKDMGYWDPMVFAAKTAGKIAVMGICSAHLTPAVCIPIIGAILSFI